MTHSWGKINVKKQCCGSGSGCFGPPGSGSICTRYGSGSGSFYPQAKMVRYGSKWLIHIRITVSITYKMSSSSSDQIRILLQYQGVWKMEQFAKWHKMQCVPRAQKEEDQTRGRFPRRVDSAGPVSPICFPDLKGRKLATRRNPRWLVNPNSGLTQSECGRLQPLLCPRHHRQV